MLISTCRASRLQKKMELARGIEPPTAYTNLDALRMLISTSRASRLRENGAGERNRTPDRLHKSRCSSHADFHVRSVTVTRKWSWREESNPRPPDYKSDALPTELRQPWECAESPQHEVANDPCITAKGQGQGATIPAEIAKPSNTSWGRCSASIPSANNACPYPPVMMGV